jgi:hypothetical protein
MGYTTYFEGSFKVEPPLEGRHAVYLHAFNDARHMERDVAMTALLPDPVREAVGLSVGKYGEYYVGESEAMAPGGDVLDYNRPPIGQPGLWCKWVPTDDNAGIEWSQEEKFYDYIKWLKYLLSHFLIPWGYQVSGSVRWEGEEQGDTGVIIVRHNKVYARFSETSLGCEQEV